MEEKELDVPVQQEPQKEASKAEELKRLLESLADCV